MYAHDSFKCCRYQVVVWGVCGAMGARERAITQFCHAIRPAAASASAERSLAATESGFTRGRLRSSARGSGDCPIIV